MTPSTPSNLLFVLTLLLVFYILVFYWLRVCGMQRLASPTSLFVVFQAVFAIATVFEIDGAEPSDVRWLFAIVSGLALFVLGAWAANKWRGFRPESEIPAFANAPATFDVTKGLYSTILMGTIVVCVAVGVLFVASVGYNVFAVSVDRFFHGGVVDLQRYATLRGNISQTKYVAVGYADQFVTVLLPILLYILYVRVRATRRFRDRLLLGTLALADFYFLTVTGGRGRLLFVLVTFLLLVGRRSSPLPPSYRASKNVFRLVLVVLVVMYGITTTIAGRGPVRSGRVSDPVRQVGLGAAQELYNRIGGANAEGHVQIMRYLEDKGPVWGKEWWASLATITPRAGKGSTFQTQLHGLLYRGNKAGSVGLTVWGSGLYNWGYIGLLILAFFLGMAFQYFTIWYVRGDRSLTRLVLLFAAGYRLATFTEPYTLLLDGVVTLLLYYFLVRFLTRGEWIAERPRVRAAPSAAGVALQTGHR